MEQNVTVDFGGMSDEQLARHALEIGSEYFDMLCGYGAVNGDSLFIRVGKIDEGIFVELGTMAYGNPIDAAAFANNTDPVDGKVGTVVHFEMDSAAAYEMFGSQVGPEGPRRWTGGVFHTARVQLPNGTWRTCKFVGAASGVQGSHDEAVTYQVLALLGASWEERELSLYAADVAAGIPIPVGI